MLFFQIVENDINSLAGNIFKSQRNLYALYGALFGLSFPVLASVLECYLKFHSYYLSNFIACQRESPLLWIIDTAPFFLGLFASLAGTQMDKVHLVNKELNERYLQMSALRETADKANRAKSEFLANMSHEIRTPMNAIIGMNYLIKKTPLNSKQFDYVNKMEGASKNLLRIIDDILDFSKIEAGKLTLEYTEIFMEELVSNLADTLNVKLQRKKDIELITNIDANIPPVVLGDAVRLRQVLLNLADNAVKFTESGEVRISARIAAFKEDGIIIRFAVKDSGIGMTAAQQETIFNPFQQADLSTTRKFGGTGLGLAISKKIVEMMDGTLALKSSPGAGSEFSFNAFFKLPGDSGKGINIGLSNINMPKGLKVLLVDDSENARIVLNDMLVSFGFNVLVAGNAREAIDTFERELGSDVPISLMIVDWRMPGMDGLQLVKELKDKNAAKAPTVLMVTAFGLEAVKEAARNKLVDGFLLKPINPSTLFDALTNVLRLGPTNELNNEEHQVLLDDFRMKLGNASVLIVEDNDINLEVAQALLGEVDIIFESARNGVEAVEKVRENTYDAVLMDIQMPEMDGLTATRIIRQEVHNEKLPILAMTAHAMKGEYEKSIAAGMNDHITKPIDPMILYTTLSNYVDRSETNRATAAKHIAEPGAIDNFYIDGIDVNMGLSRVAGKKNVYISLLTKFTSGYSDINERVNRLIADNEFTGLAGYFHTLAGVSGNMGMDAIYRGAHQLSGELKNVTGPFNPGLVYSAKVLAENVCGQIDAIKAALDKNKTELAQVAPTPKQTNVEGLENSFLQLKKLIETSDSRAMEYCDHIANSYSLADHEMVKLNASRDALNSFDFDTALKALA